MDIAFIFVAALAVVAFTLALYAALVISQLRRELQAARDGWQYAEKDLRDRTWDVRRRLQHLADNFGLQYEVTPEQGRWRQADGEAKVRGPSREQELSDLLFREMREAGHRIATLGKTIDEKTERQREFVNGIVQRVDRDLNTHERHLGALQGTLNELREAVTALMKKRTASTRRTTR